jgi:putative multiple sugar transport system permease protein
VNVTNLLLQNSYIIIMALGMLVVIVSGNIDLSVGSVMGFIGALAAVMIVNYDQPVLPDHHQSALSPAGDRRGAGLLDRLLEDPVLHRDAGRHAGLPGPVAVAAGRASRSARSRSEFQVIATGFVPDIFPAGIGAALAEVFDARKVNVLALGTGIVAAALVVWIGLRPARPEQGLRHRGRAEELLHRPQRHHCRGADLRHVQAVHCSAVCPTC